MLKRRVRHKYGPHKRGPLPSIEIVRAAVEAACDVTHAKPDEVLSRISLAHKSLSQLRVARARVYAAFALRALFEDAHGVKIAEMLWVRDSHQYMSIKDTLMKNGGMKSWWSDDAFMSVIEKTEAFIAMQTKQDEVVG